jgi:pimeloyl-ACP methyl ester carboxylesterase
MKVDEGYDRRNPQRRLTVRAVGETSGMVDRFTPSYRGGVGSPLVCLHGFLDTWRIWELVLPALERRHDVLALTLAGHAGGPRLPAVVDAATIPDAVERAMDAAGFETAHIAGNSLGGYVALQLAARGRARSVVALAPAGGWAKGDESYKEILAMQASLQEQTRLVAPHAEVLVCTPEGRRRATRLQTVTYEHIPAELLAHQIVGVARCTGAPALIAFGLRAGWPLEPQRIACPVRIVWGVEDEILPWPSAATRFREDWLPHADWVELDGVGHAPQLDVPLETAQLILGLTAG